MSSFNSFGGFNNYDAGARRMAEEADARAKRAARSASRAIGDAEEIQGKAQQQLCLLANALLTLVNALKVKGVLGQEELQAEVTQIQSLLAAPPLERAPFDFS